MTQILLLDVIQYGHENWKGITNMLQAYTHIFSHPDSDKLSELAGFGSVKFVHRL